MEPITDTISFKEQVCQCLDLQQNPEVLHPGCSMDCKPISRKKKKAGAIVPPLESMTPFSNLAYSSLKHILFLFI